MGVPPFQDPSIRLENFKKEKTVLWFVSIVLDCVAICILCASGFCSCLAAVEKDDKQFRGSVVLFILGLGVFVASQITLYSTVTLR